MSKIANEMNTKVHLEGCINGHPFTVEGEGRGKPFEGFQVMKIRVTKGSPLPFAFEMLTPVMTYGSKPFVQHPADIPDYYKQAVENGGLLWERIVTFEDGAVMTVCNQSTMKGNCFHYEVQLVGVNFPPNGPIMQRKGAGWMPVTEKLCMKGDYLVGESDMTLKLEGGGCYTCHFKTTHKAMNPAAVKLPGFHYADHLLEITSHDATYTNVEHQETSKARHPVLA